MAAVSKVFQRYKVATLITICTVHMALAFWEAPLTSSGTSCLVTELDRSQLLAIRIVEILVIIAHIVMLALTSLFYYRSTGAWKLSHVLRAVIILAFAVDASLSLATNYKTGPQGNRNFSLPYTALLRPIMATVAFVSSRKQAQTFIQTLYNARNMLLMFCIFIFVATVQSSLYLAGRVDSESLSNNCRIDVPASPYDGVGRGYDEYMASFLSIFIFTTTAANYVDAVYRPFAAVGGVAPAYFGIVYIIGQFFVLALFVAVFQSVYSNLEKKHSEETAREKRTIARKGMLVSYWFLAYAKAQDSSDFSKALPRIASGTLEDKRARSNNLTIGWPIMQEFFFVYCAFPTSQGIHRSTWRTSLFESQSNAFARICRDAKRSGKSFLDTLDAFRDECTSVHANSRPTVVSRANAGVKEFIDQADVFITDKRNAILGAKLRIRSTSKPHRRSLVERWSKVQFNRSKSQLQFYKRAEFIHRRVATMILLAHSFLALLYASRAKGSVQIFLVLANVAHFLQIVSLMCFIGWHRFWFSHVSDVNTMNRGRELYRWQANRFDTGLVLVGTIALVVSLGNTSWNDSQGSASMLWMSMPLVRWVSNILQARALLFSFIDVLPEVLSLLALLGASLYTFAVLGVWLFGGTLTETPDVVYAIRGATYDSFWNSFMTCFQLLTGESWHVVMFGTLDRFDSYVPAVFHVTFMFINAVLFAQVFVGVICDVFQSYTDTVNRAEERIELEAQHEGQTKIKHWWHKMKWSRLHKESFRLKKKSAK